MSFARNLGNLGVNAYFKKISINSYEESCCKLQQGIIRKSNFSNSPSWLSEFRFETAPSWMIALLDIFFKFIATMSWSCVEHACAQEAYKIRFVLLLRSTHWFHSSANMIYITIYADSATSLMWSSAFYQTCMWYVPPYVHRRHQTLPCCWFRNSNDS